MTITRCKIDLHTHSVASPDGGLKEADYTRMITSGQLDYVAVTDHNTTSFALELQKKLGDAIIVGEEIRTTDGEIIGLYLQETIPAGLSISETIAAIRQQNGLVYIPHPFENVRQGMKLQDVDTIAHDVDILEVHNGRAAFQNKSRQALEWAAAHTCVGAAASDSHSRTGWGKTFTTVSGVPTRSTLIELLRRAEYRVLFPGIPAILSPKLNKLAKKLTFNKSFKSLKGDQS